MEQPIAAIRENDRWNLTDSHAKVYECEDADVIFVDCVETLQIELEAMHPAPEGFTRVRPYKPWHTSHLASSAEVVDGLIVKHTCELSFDEIIEMARSEGPREIEIPVDLYREELAALDVDTNMEFDIRRSGHSSLMSSIRYAPKRIRRRNQRRLKKAKNRLKGGEIPLDILNPTTYAIWNRIKAETKMGRWLSWVDTGGKCREDWMEQIIVFSEALNKLCGENAHRKTKGFDRFIKSCEPYVGPLYRRAKGRRSTMSEDKRNEVRKRFRAFLKAEIAHAKTAPDGE